MKKNSLTVDVMKLCLSAVVMFLLSACSSAEKHQHIEVFVVETSEQDEEENFKTTGYKKVNAITVMEEGENHIKSDVKAIEDFYDTEGNYIKTEIKHSNVNKSKVTLTETGDNRKEELQEPSTILIPDDIEDFQLENMTEDEKEKVKNHVLSFMDKL